MNMEQFFIWVDTNKQWVFSGIGISALGLIWFIIKKIFFDKKKVAQSQKSGDNSINIQVGGDYVVRDTKDDTKNRR